ncbi:MAG: DUF3298 domain-containing protein [Bacteroidetes bacterium]|nr:DUF3298 domain-containing protein [Bacteroidota bacterium]MBL6942913.1 DUF3298 domain-containing protein [Bacteroidales bacterium]
MKIKQLTLFVLLLSSITIMSQQSLNNEVFYSRFEGVIGSNIQVTANIVRLFDKLSGNYQYKFIDEGTEMYYGKTINLNGDVIGGNANMKEMGQETYTFAGKLSQASFKGTWSTPDDKELDIKLKEYYPHGTLPFNIFYLHSEDMLKPDNAKSPIAEIELTLIFPEDNYFQKGIVDSVKHIITKSFFSSDYCENNPDSMLTHFEAEYFTNYKDQNTEWFANGASFNWQKIITMSVIYNSNYLLCIEYLKYAYTGGAHGMTNIAYDIIKLNDGTILTYDDIFKEGTEDTVSKILTLQLRKDYNIPGDVPLNEAGFFVEAVEPNHNFYINGNGIGFLYNSYAIAPYSYGQTNIFLEFSKISGLLKRDTTLPGINNK